MRKFIINNYFGEGKIKEFTYSKGAPLNMFQVLITGLIFNIFPIPNIISIPFLIVSLAWLLYVGMDFMGKGYFSTFPVTWDELNDKQRWYWGRYYITFPNIKKPSTLEANWKTWEKLNKHFSA